MTQEATQTPLEEAQECSRDIICVQCGDLVNSGICQDSERGPICFDCIRGIKRL